MKKGLLGLLFVGALTLLYADATEAELEAEIQKLQATLKEKKEAKVQAAETLAKVPSKSQWGHIYAGYDIAFGGGTYIQRKTVIAGNTTTTETDLAAGMGTLKFGYVNASNNRWELSFSGIETKRINNIEDTLSGMDINWFAVFDLEKSKWSPYLYTGLGSYSWENPNTTITTNKLDGVALNLGFGAVYDMEAGVEFELAYRMKIISWERYFYNLNFYDEGHALSLISLGINIHF